MPAPARDWPIARKKDRRWIDPRDNYTPNHDAVIESYEAARADVHEPSARLLHVVYFREANVARVVPARRDRVLTACFERRQNGRFTIVAGRERGLADFLLLRFFPMVVAQQEVSARVVQLEGWIGERAGHAETGQ